MLEASTGDIVFHYSRGAVRAWSNVLAPAFDGPPPFEDPTTRWSAVGRVIRVEMQELDGPIELDSIPLELRTERDNTGWPFSRRGAVKQVYLSEVAGPLADWLLTEVGLRVDVAQLSSWPDDQMADAQIEYRGDRRVVVNARGEQSLLRKHLFGDELLATCALCGRDLPVAMLVTAHIKRRADTSRAERGRTDTVMPACLIGCDSLFELGYVIVARGGTVERGPRRTPMTDDLSRAVEAVIGRTCSAWDEATEHYFAHHRRFQKARARSYRLD
ncbi:hypothetical protein [Curtobacterium sp. PhB130]|uniref:hypothetical protein n=1 Tax=Curtobacterium sp. PhB130 TaxID=2485178 RepID=UPI000F4C85A5|nr:hypothetical protein [Curtobacterium sp. PhB130]